MQRLCTTTVVLDSVGVFKLFLTHLKSTRQKTVIKKTVEHVRSIVQHIIVSKKILPIIIITWFYYGVTAILST